MITYSKTFQGAWELSALVYERGTSYAYIDHAQFFYHTKREATKLFKDHLKQQGKVIAK